MTPRELFIKYPRLVQLQLEPFRAIAWLERSPTMPEEPSQWRSLEVEVPHMPDVPMRADLLEFVREHMPGMTHPVVWQRTKELAPPEPEAPPVPAEPDLPADLFGAN